MMEKALEQVARQVLSSHSTLWFFISILSVGYKLLQNILSRSFQPLTAANALIDLCSASCLISDALLKLQQPQGGLLPSLSLWSPERQAGSTRVAGPAYTVRFVRNNQKNAPAPPNHYIDSVPAGSVLFISSPRNIPHAVYGGLMTHRAKYSGAVGAVVDGNFRDLDEQKDLKWPLWARDVSTVSYYEVARVSELNVPVRLNDDSIDTVVHPGDWLVGDANGVVCIPQSLVSQLVEMLPKMEEQEAKIEVDIRNGAKFAESSKKHRQG